VGRGAGKVGAHVPKTQTQTPRAEFAIVQHKGMTDKLTNFPRIIVKL